MINKLFTVALLCLPFTVLHAYDFSTGSSSTNGEAGGGVSITDVHSAIDEGVKALLPMELNNTYNISYPPLTDDQKGDYSFYRSNDWDAMQLTKKGGTIVDGILANFTGLDILSKPVDVSKKLTEAETDSALEAKVVDDFGNYSLIGMFANNYPVSNIHLDFDPYLVESFDGDNMKGIEIIAGGEDVKMPPFVHYSRNVTGSEDVRKIHMVLDTVKDQYTWNSDMAIFKRLSKQEEVVLPNHGYAVGDVVTKALDNVYYKTKRDTNTTPHGVVLSVQDDNRFRVALDGSTIPMIANTAPLDTLYLGEAWGEITNVKPTEGRIIKIGYNLIDSTVISIEEKVRVPTHNFPNKIYKETFSEEVTIVNRSPAQLFKTFEEVTIQPNKKIKLDLQMPVRTYSNNYSGYLVNINAKVNGVWYNLGNEGAVHSMLTSARTINRDRITKVYDFVEHLNLPEGEPYTLQLEFYISLWLGHRLDRYPQVIKSDVDLYKLHINFKSRVSLNFEGDNLDVRGGIASWARASNYTVLTIEEFDR